MQNKSTYVFFQLVDEYFAIDVKNVIEIIEMQDLTKVPETPDFMKGVTVFRGNILPVIDLRLKFSLPNKKNINESFIIVITYQENEKTQNIGLIVDKVYDVIALSELNIDDYPEIGSRYNAEFIDGIVKNEDQIIIILDVEKILSSAEIDIIKRSEQEIELFEDNDIKIKEKKEETLEDDAE